MAGFPFGELRAKYEVNMRFRSWEIRSGQGV